MRSGRFIDQLDKHLRSSQGVLDCRQSPRMKVAQVVDFLF